MNELREQMRNSQWHMPASGPENERTFRLVKEFNDLGNCDMKRGKEILTELFCNSPAAPQGHAPLNLEFGDNVEFGEGCFFNFGTTILAQAKVSFGARTMIGPHCSFITVGHPVEDHAMRAEGWEIAHPITIGKNCWFGTNITVLPGVTIGDNCVIGAGTLVTKDVPDNSLVLGSPGKVVRTLDV